MGHIGNTNNVKHYTKTMLKIREKTSAHARNNKMFQKAQINAALENARTFFVLAETKCDKIQKTKGDELNIKGFTDFLMKYAVFNFEHKRNVKNSLTPVLIFESMITRLKRTAERKGTARSNSYRKTEEDRSTSTGEKLYNI